MTSQGPLSWQQAVNLRRNLQLGVGTAQLVTPVPVPAEAPVALLRERLAAIADREDALRIIELPQDGNGTVTYADDIDVPLSVVSVDSLEQRAELVAELDEIRFSYDKGLLWKALVIEHPDQTGKPARTVYIGLDHHIADGVSLFLFRDELAGDNDPRGTYRGDYQDWVRYQHRSFPMADSAEVPTPAREFWRRYLDGTAPNRPTPLPFCDPALPFSGLEHNLWRELPTPPDALLAAAASLPTSPFLLFVASVAAAVGQLTDVDDLTLRYFAHGRTQRTLDMLGWFSDNVPLRVRSQSMADPRAALRAAASARSALQEHEATPWGYIMAMCSESDAETPQVQLNFVTLTDPTIRLRKPDDRTVPGRRGYLNMNVYLPRTGAGLLHCRFDPERFKMDGVDAFVQLVFDGMRHFAASSSAT